MALAVPPAGAAGSADELHPNLGAILRELDRAIANRDAYNARRISMDDSLKAILDTITTPSEKIAILEKLCKRYVDFQVDTAIYYGEMARNLAKQSGYLSKSKALEAIICSFLPSQGQLNEAMERFAAIDTVGMTHADRLAYFVSGTRLYFVSSHFYPTGAQHDALTEKGRRFTELYLRNAPFNSDTTRYMTAFLNELNDHHALTEANYKALLVDRDPSSQYYPLAEQALGFLYLDMGQTDAAIGCLAKALTADILTGCRSGESAYTLARELLKRGDTARGNAVLEIALDNARQSGWRIRSIQTAEISPRVVDTFLHESSVRLVWIIVLSVLLLVATFLAVWLFLHLRKARKEYRSLSEEISSTDQKQRLHFNRFLKLCAVYIETLENFTLTARRKIKMNQVDELYKMINSGDMLDEQAKRFYEIFDSAFCHAYPRFVEQLNTLLLPDKRVTTPAPGTLTTELRILAFMRIGFDESAQIARILSVSVNTIYTYRNRMRSRAISRDTFEDDIMKIGL